MTRDMSPLTAATALGVLALAPFALGLIYALGNAPDAAGRALRWLLPYTAVVVSFAGGAQWGRILAAGRRGLVDDLAFAALPALIAWPALIIPSPWRFLLLFLALVVAWLGDERGARSGWQGRGFLRLRRLLSAAVAAALLILGALTLFG